MRESVSARRIGWRARATVPASPRSIGAIGTCKALVMTQIPPPVKSLVRCGPRRKPSFSCSASPTSHSAPRLWPPALNLGPYVGSNAQGGIPEAGLVLTNGSSATVMNNIFANLDQSLIRDQVDFVVYGGGGPHPKPASIIVNGNISQDDTNGSIANDDFNENLSTNQIACSRMLTATTSCLIKLLTRSTARSIR